MEEKKKKEEKNSDGETKGLTFSNNKPVAANNNNIIIMNKIESNPVPNHLFPSQHKRLTSGSNNKQQASTSSKEIEIGPI